jgi:tRNA threonylcarbamoyl adenosine modification protein YeaZ
MNDLVLVLDLSACLSLGLVDGQGRALSARLKEQGTRGETAHALLDECLQEAGRSVGDIASICVGIGPGSFTGIRVCAAMAEGLAFAKRLPLYPFSSLAGLLSGVPEGAAGSAVSAVSAIAASGGRYFVRQSSGASKAGEASEALMTADGLFALGAPGVRLVTAGHFPDRERMGSAFADLKRHEEIVDIAAMARLAMSGTPVTDGVLRPNYLMASAAEEKRRTGEASP